MAGQSHKRGKGGREGGAMKVSVGGKQEARRFGVRYDVRDEEGAKIGGGESGSIIPATAKMPGAREGCGVLWRYAGTKKTSAGADYYCVGNAERVKCEERIEDVWGEAAWSLGTNGGRGGLLSRTVGRGPLGSQEAGAQSAGRGRSQGGAKVLAAWEGATTAAVTAGVGGVGPGPGHVDSLTGVLVVSRHGRLSLATLETTTPPSAESLLLLYPPSWTNGWLYRRTVTSPRSFATKAPRLTVHLCRFNCCQSPSAMELAQIHRGGKHHQQPPRASTQARSLQRGAFVSGVSGGSPSGMCGAGLLIGWRRKPQVRQRGFRRRVLTHDGVALGPFFDGLCWHARWLYYFGSEKAVVSRLF